MKIKTAFLDTKQQGRVDILATPKGNYKIFASEEAAKTKATALAQVNVTAEPLQFCGLWMLKINR